MSLLAPARHNRLMTLVSTPYFRWCMGVAILCIGCSFVLILWRLFPDIYGNEIVPLHYNIHYGVDWTGAWWQIFLYPLAGVGVCVINTVAALVLVRKEPMLTRVVLVSTALLSMFLFCATVFVVLMNVVYG